MSDRPFTRGIYYFDLMAVLIVAIIVSGHHVMWDDSAPALARDVAGLYVPLLAVALLVAFRRRVHMPAVPWVAQVFAALTLVAIAVISWRWHVMVFMAAMLGGSVLLLGGLVLRTRRLSESLSRTDVVGLVAAAGSVLLTVTLAEATLRLASGLFNEEVQQLLRGADPANFGVAHPYIGHLHTPHNTFVLSGRDFRAVHNVDGLGFRNSWPWPDGADIVAVGDSVTFGQCVEDDEAWPSVIRQRLAPLRLVNLGLIGAGPQHYARVFETFGVKLRPRLVLVGVFARNDFWDADQFDRWLESGVGGNYMVWRDFGRPPRLALSLRHPRQSLDGLVRSCVLPAVRRSYVFALLRGLRGGVEGGAPPPPRIVHFEDGRSLQLLEDDLLDKARHAQPGQRVFQLALESLQQVHALASNEGAHVLMVLLPGKEEVYLPLLGVTTLDPTSALRSALNRLNIEYLNLTPGFRARAAAGEQLFFEVDGHPNGAGQALIAQLVHEHIRKNAGRYGLAD